MIENGTSLLECLPAIFLERWHWPMPIYLANLVMIYLVKYIYIYCTLRDRHVFAVFKRKPPITLCPIMMDSFRPQLTILQITTINRKKCDQISIDKSYQSINKWRRFSSGWSWERVLERFLIMFFVATVVWSTMLHNSQARRMDS